MKRVARRASFEYRDDRSRNLLDHSSILVWGILRTEEPGRLQSMGGRVRHN